MNPRPLLSLALALAVSGAARAADLTLYSSFAEVREAVRLAGGRFEWSPTPDLAGTIVPGSLTLEYASVTSLTQLGLSPNLLAAFEGKEVLVRRGAELVRARLVNAEQLLFEANDGFFVAELTSVVLPNLDGVRLRPTFAWTFTGAGGGATLSYLTRGLAWNPRYTLAVSGEAARLESWADLRNGTTQAFEAPALSLVAGEVNLAAPDAPPLPYGAMAAAAAEARSDALPKVQASGELAGLQTFRYPRAITLPAQSTTSVRFLDAAVKLERVAEYASGFRADPRVVVPLQRTYTLRADKDLPAGVVTVREDNRVVGQARLGDTPKAEAVTLRLGADFDLRLTRAVQQLERTKTSARYKVNFSLVNAKARPVTVRIRESFGPNFELASVVLPNLKREAEGYVATATLAPGARLEASYVVTFTYR